MSVAMVLLVAVPLVATLMSLRTPQRVVASVTAVTGIICLALAVALEVAFVLDLLVAVVVFGISVRSNPRRTRSPSTETLDRPGDSR
jgi:membrane protein implicated in regulation of membrane protease activity